MPFILLLLYAAFFPVQLKPTDGLKLTGTTWRVAEIHEWHNMEKLYTGETFQFTTADKVTATNGKEHTEGKYTLHPTPPDLEIEFTRTINGTINEAKDEFNVEIPNDSVLILKPFFRGGGESYIKWARVK